MGLMVILICKQNWRLMMGLASVPGMIQLTFIIFFPESPRWLMKNDKMGEASQILEKIM
jgi:Sugar (and other) transporter